MKKGLSVLLLAALLFTSLPFADAASSPAGLKIVYEDKDISLKTQAVDIISKSEIRLSAVSGDKGESEQVVWNTSDAAVATVDENGVVTVVNEEGGSVNISCRAADGSGRTSGTRLVLTKKVHRMSLSHYLGLNLRAQSIITLKPKFYAPDGSEYTPSDPQLKWEIYSGSEHAYFSNPVSGTLCTNAVDTAQIVRVVVKSGDNPQAAAVLSINVSPIIESIKIIHNDADVSGKELSFPAHISVRLRADCDPDQNSRAIKWSSSSSSITVVDGLVTANAPGKAIITAAAVDGSGKSAAVTVIFN